MKSAISFSVLFFTCLFLSAQGPAWSEVTAKNQNNRIQIQSFRQVSVEFTELKAHLEGAIGVETLISLPHPDGGTMDFVVSENSIMAPELQENYPNIRTFAGRGVGENSDAIARLDYTVHGFHAQVLMPGKTFFIDPVSQGDVSQYMVYNRSDFYAETPKQMPQCTVMESPHNDIEAEPLKYDSENPAQGTKGGFILKEPGMNSRTVVGTQRREYDLAVACTGEYAQFHGGTTAGALSAIVTSMNRINGLFLRDLSLEMILVANNDDLIFLNASTDPYSNTNTSAMLSQNQTTVDNEIGSGNYDIGHVFATGGGGVAFLNSPCNNSIKAGGVSSLPSPVGDPFDVDYVAHEMGHQWGARHTQNNNCNRSSSAAFEPGSASTIMGYAGICSPNLQNNSDDHFHNHSFNEMVNFSVNGNGNSCATVVSTGNTPPSLSLQSGGFFIPIETPFELTATASDDDLDELTYCWEQYDLGPATASSDFNLTNPSGNAPIFRSWSPTTNPTRVFPRISNLVSNTTVIGELLPTYSRDLTFRCTVRDNASNGGGVRDAQVAFEATASAGPFLVTSPNSFTTWTGGSNQTILWDVANTNNSPVNCSNVDIFLSTDGGFTYPISLASNVANDGSYSIVVPNIPTSSARIKVKGANNIFFDISNSNFAIQPGTLFENDAAFNGFISPQNEICTNILTPEISVLNLGTNALTTLTITYSITGQSSEVFEWTGNIPSGASQNVVLPSISVNPGSLNLFLSQPNGQADENLSNNAGSIDLTVSDIEGLPLPVTNGFQSTNFPGTGWSVENPDGATTWERTTAAGGFGSSSASATINFYNYNAPGQEDDIVSPWLDLTEAVVPELDFDYAYARYSASFFDRMQVQILESCETEWETLWDESNLNLATAGSITSPFTPTSSQWENIILDLSNYAGSTVRVRFRGITGWGNNLYLDNVNISETAPEDCNGDAGGSAFIDNCGNCVGGNTGSDPCLDCPPGFFENNGSCTPCPPGTFCPGDGNSFPCPSGTVQNQEGSTECISCGPGSQANADQTICELCPPGTFSAGDGQPCLPCPSGTISGEGAAQCDLCPGGSEASDDQTSCETCQPGTFSNPNTNGCTDCPEGLVSGAGATECFSCGPGTQPSADQSTCETCPPGTFSSGNGQPCLPCPAGTISGEGAAQCDLCPGGSEASEDQSSCETCLPGTFSNANTNGCTTCPEGQVSSAGATQCSFCPAGSQASADQSTCETCPPGTFSSGDGQPCLPCPAGTVSGEGATECNACGPGTFIDGNECTPCPPGTFCPGDGNSYPCAAGSAQDQEGSTSCDLCPPGSFSGEPGSQTCDLCPGGTFSQESGSNTCLDCPAGTDSGPGAVICLELDCAGVPGGNSSLDECGVCDDNPANDNTTCLDCAGIPNGPNTIDQCGVCDADPSNDNSTCLDCAGVPNGNSTLDQCGVCDDNPGNDNQTCLDCAGVPNGNSTLDDCGVCDDNPANDNSTCLDCSGIPNGPNTIDECGVCDADPSNDNSTCLDCAGIPNGPNAIDECGVCDADPSNDNQTCLDCAGVPNGNSTLDDCGVCDDNPANDNSTCLDCAGIPNGPNTIDECGVCDADPSNDNSTCLDCAGIPNGPNAIDECGVCDADPSNDNQTCLDCAGVPNGASTIDQCGVCDDNSANDNESCTDCAGVVNGEGFLDSCGDCVGGTTGADPCSISIDFTVDIDVICLPRDVRVAFYLPGSTILLEEFEGETSPDGEISIDSDLDAGDYDIYVKVESYLSKGFYNFSLQGDQENAVSVENLKIGDINGDDFINFFDGSGLNPFFGSSIGQPNYSSTADLNCDGTVNFFDGSSLNLFFGENGDEP